MTHSEFQQIFDMVVKDLNDTSWDMTFDLDSCKNYLEIKDSGQKMMYETVYWLLSAQTLLSIDFSDIQDQFKGYDRMECAIRDCTFDDLERDLTRALEQLIKEDPLVDTCWLQMCMRLEEFEDMKKKEKYVELRGDRKVLVFEKIFNSLPIKHLQWGFGISQCIESGVKLSVLFGYKISPSD